ncbi:MAG: hypothetical protein ACK4TF_00745 [Thermodesulfovibrionales bacterium]
MNRSGEDRLQAIDLIPRVLRVIDKVKMVFEKYNKEIKFTFLFGSCAKGEAEGGLMGIQEYIFSKGLSDEEKVRFS